MREAEQARWAASQKWMSDELQKKKRERERARGGHMVVLSDLILVVGLV